MSFISAGVSGGHSMWCRGRDSLRGVVTPQCHTGSRAGFVTSSLGLDWPPGFKPDFACGLSCWMVVPGGVQMPQYQTPKVCLRMWGFYLIIFQTLLFALDNFFLGLFLLFDGCVRNLWRNSIMHCTGFGSRDKRQPRRNVIKPAAFSATATHRSSDTAPGVVRNRNASWPSPKEIFP